MLSFEWDEKKNRTNQAKHKVSFEEAQTVFYDERALVIDDPEHSEEEERFVILGMSAKANLLIVCHTQPGGHRRTAAAQHGARQLFGSMPKATQLSAFKLADAAG